MRVDKLAVLAWLWLLWWWQSSRLIPPEMFARPEVLGKLPSLVDGRCSRPADHRSLAADFAIPTAQWQEHLKLMGCAEQWFIVYYLIIVSSHVVVGQ